MQRAKRRQPARDICRKKLYDPQPHVVSGLAVRGRRTSRHDRDPLTLTAFHNRRVQAWRDDKLSSRFDRLLGLLNGQDCPRAHRKVGHLLFHFPYCRGGSICPKSNFDQRDPAFQECPGHRHGVLFRLVQLCHRNNADPVDLLVHGTHVTIILSDV